MLLANLVHYSASRLYFLGQELDTADIQDSWALAGPAGLGFSLSIHSHFLEVAGLVCLLHSTIRMTFVEEVARVVMNMVVGYWCRSQSRNCCSTAGMPCGPVGNCRQDKVYLSSRVQDSEDEQSQKSIVFVVEEGRLCRNYSSYSSIRDLAEDDRIRQLQRQ